MPDGDRVHTGLSRRYQKNYKLLCEGLSNSETLAAGVVESILRQLHESGDEPAHLVHQIAEILNFIPKEPLLQALTKWDVVSRKIDQLVASTYISKRISNQITQAAKELLYDIRNVQHFPHIGTELMERFLRQVYVSDFEQRVPMARHYNDATQEQVNERLSDMRPLVEKKLKYIAKNAAKRTSFQHLRQPRTVRPRIDLYETDVLKGI